MKFPAFPNATRWLVISTSFSILSLAGCVQLPTSVNVQVGPSISVEEGADLSFYSPSRPIPGADQQSIVAGLLNAGTGPQSDYEVARAHLTEEASATWRPSVEVLVRSGPPNYETKSEGIQLVTISVIATIDEFGRYHRLSKPETRILRYELEQRKGEWRVSSAPNLTVVTLPVFEVVFQEHFVYFVDSSYRYLVPQSRWFAPNASTATRLVNSLLDGPGDELLGALRTGVPPETRLTVDAVRVSEGTAYVDLNPIALQADPEQRSLMLSQLQTTLRQLPSVNQVQVSISNNPQDIESAEISVPTGVGIMMALKDDGLYRVSGRSAVAVGYLTRQVVDSEPYAFDFDDENRYLQLSAAGLKLIEPVRLGTEQLLLTDQPDLLAPQFDVFGFAWTLSQAGGEYLSFNRLGEPAELNQSKNRNIVTFQISPDGSRIAELRSTSTGAEIVIRGVIRDRSGKPKAIVGLLPVNLAVGSALDLSWAGYNALMVMESSGGSGNSVLGHYPLEGPWLRYPATINPAVSVIASPSGTSIHYINDRAELWSLSGGSWRLSQEGIIHINFTR